MASYRLDLSYEDYIKNGKSIADSSIAQYIIYEKLDSGAFGSVYRGMHRQTGKQVAVKVIDLAAIERDDCSARVKEIRRRLAKTESQMMLKVNDEHVMKCYATFENKWLKIMVIEYCNGGTLSEQVYRRGRIPQSEAIQILRQIITGISAMHQLNIIHRDLKADNIMSHNGIYKIVDLGFAKMIPKDSETYNTTLGTIITMAPQVMRKQKYGLKADIWSIGIIFYQMIYGRIPYEPMKAPEMYDQIVQKNIFPNDGSVNGIRPSNQVLQLMKKILVIDQRHRLDWEQLVSDPLFRPSKNLPDQFRMTTNINHLKKAAQVKERDENDVIEQLPSQKSIAQEGVTISKLKNKQKEALLGKIDRTQDQILHWARQTHNQCLKTELIIKQIINPIQTQKLFNLNERKNVQMMYLIISRCFFNMSFVMDQLEHQKHAIVQNLKRTVNDLYDTVTKKFQHYSQLLTQKENKMGSIIGDRFTKIFNNSEIKTKDKFLTGIENIEFTKNQQIKFTFDKYIYPSLPQIVNKNKNVHKHMEKYVPINMVTLEQLQNTKFAQKVQQILH